MAPIGVAPERMSMMDGAPPQTMGEPASASWWRTIPARVSAACWTIAPISVTGAATPASGIEMSSAGTCARARSITFRQANSDQVRGGDGQTSNTARGFSARAARPPASMASRSIMIAEPRGVNAPVTTGLELWTRHRNRRYRSPISVGTSWATMAVDTALYAGSASATRSRRARSAAWDRLASSVSGSSIATPDEPGSKLTTPCPYRAAGLPARSNRLNSRGTVSRARRTMASGMLTRSPSAVAPLATSRAIASGSSTLVPGLASSARASSTTRSIREGSRISNRGRIGSAHAGRAGPGSGTMGCDQPPELRVLGRIERLRRVLASSVRARSRASRWYLSGSASHAP